MGREQKINDQIWKFMQIPCEINEYTKNNIVHNVRIVDVKLGSTKLDRMSL